MEIGSKLKFYRKMRKMSLRDIAAKASCSIAVLSELETNNTSPTLRTMEKVCTSLGITVADFLQTDTSIDEPVVIRRDLGQKKVLMAWNGVKLFQLMPGDISIPFTAVLLHFEPGAKMPTRRVLGSRRQLCVVLSGEMEIVIEEKSQTLNNGDSIYFDLMMAHQWINIGEGSAEVLLTGPGQFELFEQIDEDVRWHLFKKREKRRMA